MCNDKSETLAHGHILSFLLLALVIAWHWTTAYIALMSHERSTPQPRLGRKTRAKSAPVRVLVEFIYQAEFEQTFPPRRAFFIQLHAINEDETMLHTHYSGRRRKLRIWPIMAAMVENAYVSFFAMEQMKLPE